MKILYVGPLKDFSGYASAGRDYVLALDKAGADVATRDLRYDGGDYQRTPLEEKLSAKSLEGVDVVIQNTTPNEMERKEGVLNVAAFCWETDKIPAQWIDALNKMDLVLVPSQENLDIAVKCGVNVPIEKVPYATDVDKFDKPVAPFQMPDVGGKFKFLSVCQYSKKKGVDALLRAYFAEFSPNDNVVLILKTYVGPMDGDAERQKVLAIIDNVKQAMRLKEYPPIKLIHEVLPFAAMERLYKSADCYVLPSRGEGWGVPHFDAMGYGLPTIATKGTGPQEFLTAQCGWLVDSHLSPVIDMPHPFDYLYTAKENWHEPHVGELKSIMREAQRTHALRNSNPTWNLMVEAAKKRAKEFSHAAVGEKLLCTIMRYYEMWSAK